MSTTNYSTYSDFYKVSFITTSSVNIPKLLKQTGGLIIMNHTDDYKCSVNPNHGNHHPKSLWFRGDMVASGYGALCEEERDKLTYLAGAYNNLFSGIDQNFNNLSYWQSTYHDEFISSYAYTISHIEKVRNNTYSYVASELYRLIGCAPDTLDTLGEIAHWLEHDQAMGLDTIAHVKDIASTYVWHYDPVNGDDAKWNSPLSPTDNKGIKYVDNDSSYTYIGEWGLQTIDFTAYYDPSHKFDENHDAIIKDSDGNWVMKIARKDANGNIITDEDNNILYLYCSYDPGNIASSYNTFTTVYNGRIAMKDYQISTHYNENPTLMTVLNCMLHEYEYVEPCVYMVSYGPAYAEIGTTIDAHIDLYYNSNDASSMTSLFNQKCNISDHEEDIVTFPIELNIINHGSNLLNSEYSYTYSEAIQGYYPQLRKASIYQESNEGKWTNKINTSTIHDEIYVYGMFKLYGNSLNSKYSSIPMSKSDVIRNGVSQYINDLGNTEYSELVTIGEFTINENNDKIWFAIPSLYDFDAYMLSVDNDIMQPISLKNDSDILTFEAVASIQWYGSYYYDIYSFTNNRSLMANDYKLILRLKRYPKET